MEGRELCGRDSTQDSKTRLRAVVERGGVAQTWQDARDRSRPPPASDTHARAACRDGCAERTPPGRSEVDELVSGPPLTGSGSPGPGPPKIKITPPPQGRPALLYCTFAACRTKLVPNESLGPKSRLVVLAPDGPQRRSTDASGCEAPAGGMADVVAKIAIAVASCMGQSRSFDGARSSTLRPHRQVHRLPQ